MTKFDKSKLPSRHVTEGPERAPHRSYYYAMGLTEEEIHRPFVGVATCWNEAAPCNIALMRQAQAAKKGVKEGGGTPREFCTITVTDGIAMGHEGMKSSLVSREVIADSVELTMRGHCYDALVGLAGCDKSLPGMMMAMLRLNVPSVFLYGGTIMPGRFHGKDVTVVDVFEAVGKHSAGSMSGTDLHELECVACPGAGACGGQYTANTMACVSEAIGLALPFSAGPPAVVTSRDEYAHTAGEVVMKLLAANIRPRDIVTLKALENAATIVAATGGSTNAALHLPAMANEAGIKFDLFDVAAIFKRTPYLASLKPGGEFVAKDMWEAGGVPMLLRTLLDGGFIHGDCMTVTGKTIAENIRDVKFNPNQKVMRPVERTARADRRRRRAQGQPRARWCHRESRGPEEPPAPRTRAHLRLRRGRLRRRPGARLQGRRRDRDPLRGTQGRSRHARDAVDHRRALRAGPLRSCRADHRRTVLGCHARLLRRPCRAGSRRRRTDRPPARRRHHRPRRGEGHDRCRALGRGTRRASQVVDTETLDLRLRARCGATPATWGPRATAP